jgi:hypothetical protein
MITVNDPMVRIRKYLTIETLQDHDFISASHYNQIGLPSATTRPLQSVQNSAAFLKAHLFGRAFAS